MTDARFRELERRWQEGASLEGEARYLLERVRVGDLSAERLRLASHCGHEGAKRALGALADEEPLLCDWCFALTEWGREAAVRAALAACSHLLKRWTWPHPTPDLPRVLRAGEACASCPCSDHRRRALDLVREANEEVVAVEGERDLGVLLHHTASSRAACAVLGAAQLAATARFGDEERRDLVRVVTDCADVLDSPDELRAAIGSEVAGWALARSHHESSWSHGG